MNFKKISTPYKTKSGIRGKQNQEKSIKRKKKVFFVQKDTIPSRLEMALPTLICVSILFTGKGVPSENGRIYTPKTDDYKNWNKLQNRETKHNLGDKIEGTFDDNENINDNHNKL